jgi:hypothetical protein
MCVLLMNFILLFEKNTQVLLLYCILGGYFFSSLHLYDQSSGGFSIFAHRLARRPALPSVAIGARAQKRKKHTQRNHLSVFFINPFHDMNNIKQYTHKHIQ